MVMTGIAVFIVLGVGYVWMNRGFFSALIHLVCTVIAGAVAFGLWEHTAYFLLDFAPAGGILSFLSGTAWGLGLAIPFAVTLALLRVIVDSVVRANVDPGKIGNYIGGGICGALSGIIASGIIVISMGFLRMETGFMGATHVGYADKGYIVRKGTDIGGLLVPVDKLTAMLYGKLSQASFRVEEPLGKYHPNLHEEPASFRLNAFEGKARNTTKPDDFKVMARYTVGKDHKISGKALYRDRWNPGPQDTKDVNGNDYPDGSHIEMLMVKFLAGAKEKDGKIAVGAGQVRLLLQKTSDEEDRIEVYPIAADSQQTDPKDPSGGRWRFDGRDVFISSVGGASEALFGFEFVVPPEYEPVALYVKGIRHLISSGPTAKPTKDFASTDERDGYIVNMNGGHGKPPDATETVDMSRAVTIGNGQALKPGDSYQPVGVRISNGLPFTLQDGTFSGLDINDEGKKYVLGGETTLEPDYWSKKGSGIEKALRIEAFATNDDTELVQVDVGGTTGPINIPNEPTNRAGLLSPAAATADRSLAPLLWDVNGTPYQPIGYIYGDETKVIIRFKPGEPITALSQTPALTKSRPAQKLTLIFRVSFGVQIDRLSVGKFGIAKYDPPIPCDQSQKMR